MDFYLKRGGKTEKYKAKRKRKKLFITCSKSRNDFDAAEQNKFI